MLSGSEILQEVKSGNVNIYYSFLPFDSAGKRLSKYIYQGSPVKASEENVIALEYLKSKIVRDRLGMSAGAIYRPFSNRKISKKLRFKGHSDLVDISGENSYYMKPGEMGIVLSNEYIDFKTNHSALIVSRVSNYPKGLVIQAAYIDSTSMGVLRFVITNVSNKPIKLHVGQDLARVFLFKTLNPLYNDRIMGEVSPHYGQNWPNILNDGLHPFQSLQESESWYSLFKLKEWLKDYGLTLSVGTIFVGLIYMTPFLYNLTDGIRSLSEIKKTLKSIEEKNSVTFKEVKELNLLRRMQGTTAISFQNGKLKSNKSIKIENKVGMKAGSVFVYTNDGDSTVRVYGSLELNSNYIIINMNAFRNDFIGDKLINVIWVIFPI